jgi:peptidoglycan/xylan/chitin deacetylase (PgdA/CDA1 family)
MNSRVLAISYHYVRGKEDIPHPGIHPVTPEVFLQQIEQLRNHHPIITPDQFESWMNGHSPAPSSVLLTFDDGLRDHLPAANELERLGLRGAFFVCSRPALEGRALPVHKVHWLRAHTPPEEFLRQFSALLPANWQSVLASPPVEIQKAAAETYQFDAPEHQVLKYLINFTLPYECVDEVTSRMLPAHGLDEAQFCQRTYLSDEEIRAMAERGHLIGCHGHLHQPLSRFDHAGLLADIETNKRFLQGLGIAPSWLAYPYGSEWSLPSDTRKFTTDAGIRAAFTYDRGWNTPQIAHDRLRRIDCNEIDAHLTSTASS